MYLFDVQRRDSNLIVPTVSRIYCGLHVFTKLALCCVAETEIITQDQFQLQLYKIIL